MKSNLALNFSFKLVLILVVSFGIHLLVLNFLELPLFENKIVLSYSINILMAILIFTSLFILKKNFKDQLGFLFLIGSSLKFLMFFLLFYKEYKLDGIISKTEFAAFFVPYILCLIIEVFSLSKWLNRID